MKAVSRYQSGWRCRGLLLASVIFSITMAGELTLMQTQTLDGESMRFELGPAQRCFSFPCYENRTSFAMWTHMQKIAYISFYADRGCRGDMVRISTTLGNAFNASEHGMDKISSAMVLELGRYPTRGNVQHYRV